MKKILLIILLTALYSCKESAETKTKNEKTSLEQKLLSAARKYFDVHLIDTLNTIDSFYIVRLDTLTEKWLNQYRWRYENSRLKVVQAKLDLLGIEVKQWKLYAMMGIHIQDKKELQDSLAIVRIEFDTIVNRMHRYLKLDSIIDSTTFVHYLPLIRMIETLPDNTQTTNDYNIAISKEFKVVPLDQYLED